MKKKLSILRVVGVVVLIALVLAACGAPAPPPAEETPAPPAEDTPTPPPAVEDTPTPPPAAEPLEIEVGVIDTYSGGPSIYCEDALNGFMLALDEIHEAGDVRIEYTTRDTKFDVAVGLPMAKELVLNEEVDVLVGTISSGVALAVSEYAKEEKVPFIVWISKSEKITGEQGHRYVFSSGENTRPANKYRGAL